MSDLAAHGSVAPKPVHDHHDDMDSLTILLAMIFSVLLLADMVIGVDAYFHHYRHHLDDLRAQAGLAQVTAEIQHQQAQLQPHWVDASKGMCTMGIGLAKEAIYQQYNGGQSPLESLAAGGAAAPVKAGNKKQMIAMGQKLSVTLGCTACHSMDGTPKVGPTWKNIAGYKQTLTTGKVVVTDYAFLKTMILHPGKMDIKGALPGTVMPANPELAPAKDPHHVKLDALIWYINSLSDKANKASEPPAGK